MPIAKLENNLYRIRDLSVGLSGDEYYLNMNPAHAQACVLCISRVRPISVEELQLTEENLEFLFSGGTLEFDSYVLQGISGRQLAALAQYRQLRLQPPAYIQAWAMSATQTGKNIYVPDDPNEQCILVPVHYQVIINGGNLLLKLDEAEGYSDGDLLYQIEDHLPVPIPKSALGTSIPLRAHPDKLRVVPDESVRQNYIQKRN